MPSLDNELDTARKAHQAGRFQEARRSYETYLEKAHGDGHALFLYGSLLTTMGETSRAIAVLQECVARWPKVGIAHNALGNAFLKQGNVASAENAYRSSIGCVPLNQEAFCNLGYVFRTQGKLLEAIELYQQALLLNPNFVEALCNLGVALQGLNRLDEALVAFARAKALSPSLPAALFNESLIQLLKGDYAAGWKGHEYRWMTEQKNAYRKFSVPLWTGIEPLAGKNILIHAEQGFGDTLQFVRYLPLLVERGAIVHMETQAALKSVLAEMKGLASLLEKGSSLPGTLDFHCPIMSLPLAFGTEVHSIPSQFPYLSVPATKQSQWKQRLEGLPRPRVGFAWFGNRAHKNDRNRSLPSDVAAELLRQSPIPLICLQKGLQASDDLALSHSLNLHVLPDEIQDFSDTAAIVQLLDLVISVDTSVVHLAGALGKPVWALIPYAPDWRWMLDRNDSPWYPSALLYRQKRHGDWSGVISELGRDLRTFAGGAA